MWVSSFNTFYWSMCTDLNGKYKNYHVEYFPFLADKEKDIEEIYFYGYSTSRKFVHLTTEQKNRLKIYTLLDGICKN